PQPPPPSSTLFPYTTLFRSGRLQRRQAGENEVKENEREGIERARGEYDPVDDYPDDKDTAERQDESPTPAELGDFIRQMLAKSQDRKSTRLNSSHVAISYAV